LKGDGLWVTFQKINDNESNLTRL